MSLVFYHHQRERLKSWRSTKYRVVDVMISIERSVDLTPEN